MILLHLKLLFLHSPQKFPFYCPHSSLSTPAFFFTSFLFLLTLATISSHPLYKGHTFCVLSKLFHFISFHCMGALMVWAWCIDGLGMACLDDQCTCIEPSMHEGIGGVAPRIGPPWCPETPARLPSGINSSLTAWSPGGVPFSVLLTPCFVCVVDMKPVFGQYH